MSIKKKLAILGIAALVSIIPMIMIVAYVFNHMILESFGVPPWSIKQIVLSMILWKLVAGKVEPSKPDLQERFDDMLQAFIASWTNVIMLTILAFLLNAFL